MPSRERVTVKSRCAGWTARNRLRNPERRASIRCLSENYFLGAGPGYYMDGRAGVHRALVRNSRETQARTASTMPRWRISECLLMNLLFEFGQTFEQNVSRNRKRAGIDLVERVLAGMPVIKNGAFKINDVRCRNIALQKWVVIV